MLCKYKIFVRRTIAYAASIAFNCGAFSFVIYQKQWRSCASKTNNAFSFVDVQNTTVKAHITFTFSLILVKQVFNFTIKNRKNLTWKLLRNFFFRVSALKHNGSLNTFNQHGNKCPWYTMPCTINHKQKIFAFIRQWFKKPNIATYNIFGFPMGKTVRKCVLKITQIRQNSALNNGRIFNGISGLTVNFCYFVMYFFRICCAFCKVIKHHLHFY